MTLRTSRSRWGTELARVVVTGASGFIGTHLSAHLSAERLGVVGVDLLGGDDVIASDLRHGDLHDIVGGADAVVHLAARPGVQASWGEGLSACMDHNVTATARLLEAATHARVPRVVVASSSSVYGPTDGRASRETDPPNPVSPYAVSKLAAEQLAKVFAQRGLPVVSLRFFTVYGPRQRPDMAFSRLISAALGGSCFEVRGSGRQRRDFTYVGDVVDAVSRACVADLAPGTILNVGGGRPASLLDAVAMVESATGRRVDLRHVPRPPGDPASTSADLERVGRLLGWIPRTELPDGIAAQVAAVVGAQGSGARVEVRAAEPGAAIQTMR